MNKKRREKIGNVIDRLDSVRNEIDSIRDEEQDAFDSLPEQFQSSYKGEDMEKAIEALEDASARIYDAVGFLEAARE